MFVLTAAYLALGLSGVASDSPRALSLEAAFAFAWAHSPAIASDKLRLRSSNHDYLRALDAYGPTIQATGEFDRQTAVVDEGSFFLGSVSRPYQASTLSGRTYLSQSLYTGGHLAAQLDAAAASVREARAQLREDELTLLHHVIEDYADIIANRAILAATRQSRSALEEESQHVKLKLGAGVATITDVAQIAGRMAASQIQEVTARAALEKSIADFEVTVGAPATDVGSSLDLPSPPSQLQAAVAIAEIVSPTVLKALARERSAYAQLESARSAVRPQASFRMEARNVPLEEYQPALYDKSFTFGLNVSIPLFTSGASREQILSALANLTAERQEVLQEQRRTRLQVEQQWSSLIAAEQILPLVRDEYGQQRIAYETLRVKYENGLATTTDLLLAEQQSEAAREETYRAERTRVGAVADLLQSVGLLTTPHFHGTSTEDEVLELQEGASPVRAAEHLLEAVDRAGVKGDNWVPLLEVTERYASPRR